MQVYSRKLIRILIFSALCALTSLTPAAAQSWSNGYTYRRAITIDHTKVPNTDQTNFPVLISGTYSYLATTGNSGNVSNASGYDIAFTSDSAGSVLLNWETESYDPATGAIVAWVKIPRVSHTTDTTIYMFYGNAAIGTFQGGATGSVWDSGFVGVYHFKDPLGLSDSSLQGNDLSNVNTVTSATGKIGGGGFSGT